MNPEDKLNLINSRKVQSITSFTNCLHDLVAELYESLVDDDISSAKNTKVEIIRLVSDLKIDFN